jgi:hypothetical protein
VRDHDDLLRVQSAVRHLLPAHRSTSGAEATAQRLRNLYEQRSFSLRNASRTNLLLGLTRLHLNNRDDVNAYHRICVRPLKQPKDSRGRDSASTATHATTTAPLNRRYVDGGTPACAGLRVTT